MKMKELLFITIVIIVMGSNFYIFKFQDSIDGKDERGKVIQLQMTKVMYHVLFLGMVIILSINAMDIISDKLAITIISGLVFLNTGVGCIFLYLRK
jgi:hypothetical protein